MADSKTILVRRNGWIGIIAIALAALAVGWYANRFGTDVIPDSAEYISGGIRLADGDGYSQPNRSGPPIPLTWFPPLFPLLIAGFERLHLPLYKAIGFFNAGCYGLVVGAAGIWVWRATGSAVWSCIAALLVLTNHAIYWIHSFVLSEPLFMLWMLGYLWSLYSWRRHRRFRSLALAGACIGCGLLTRFAGLTLVPAGAIVVLFTPGVRAKRKLVAIALLLFLALAPAAIWSRWHTPVHQSATGRSIHWHPIGVDILQNGVQILASFVVPSQAFLHIPPTVLLIGFACVFIFCWIYAARWRGRTASPHASIELGDPRAAAVQVCLIVILSYLFFLIASISFVDGTLDERFLSILSVPMAVIFCIGGQTILDALQHPAFRIAAGCALGGVLIAHGANLLCELRQRQSAADLAWFPTLQSDTLDALRDIPPWENVWSDKAYGIFMAYRLRTDELPYQPADPATDADAYEHGIQSLREELNDEGGGWIVFWHQLDDFGDGLLTEDDIRQNFVVTQEQKYEDGVLMRIDKPLDKPAAASTHPS